MFAARCTCSIDKVIGVIDRLIEIEPGDGREFFGC